jgi:hypothetical protein
MKRASNNPVALHHPARWRACLLLACGLWLLASSSPSLAQPTQEQVFRSIGENLDRQKTDSGRTMALCTAAAGLTLLLVVLSQFRKREVAPRAFNHPGKLQKQLAKSLHLKPVEIKQLKVLADQQGVTNPLTLLLCPSVLAKSMKESDAPVDPQLVSSVMRKLAGRT